MMEKVCPVCNSLYTIKDKCDNCNGIMEDKGRADEYMDPYSNQMPISDSKDYCIHIFECNDCKKFYRKHISKLGV
ncbi:hypothetical protein [Clostridium tetani]|nr:hypothetical protein [Clostridium tetani]